MKKHIPTALAVIAALAICVIGIGAANANEAPNLVPEKLTAALGDTKASPLNDDAEYEAALGTELTSAKSDKYVYLFDAETNGLKSVLLTAEAAPSGSPISEDAAVEKAGAIFAAAFPNEDSGKFDVKCSQTADGRTVEFRQKLADDLYGGSSIAFTLNGGGELRSLVRTDTDAGAWQDNAGKAIGREKAIELALAAADGGVSNADITAYKEAKNDGILWQVDIANVDIGNGWTATYFVTLNALTGEVVSVDMTR